MKNENIDDNRKYQENLYCVFCFLFDVLHINCAQYNLAICVSVIYDGYVTVEIEYNNLTSLIM
jgi:hypothetical protein